MLLKVLGYIGMTVVVGLLVQTMVTTYYLGKINSGLNASLDSTNKLIHIQNTIIEKNQALKDVVDTTKKMDAQLVTTLKTTQNIHIHITKINDLNSATLQLNQNMVSLGAQSGQSLGIISSDMNVLKQSTEELYSSLAKLQSWIRQDRSNMGHMKAYTDQMNQKVPGVLQ